MDTREILEQLQKEQITLDQADHLLRRQPYEELGYAKLDMHRKVRSGCAEVIFCQGKADDHLLSIFSHLYEADGEVFGTRANEHQYALIREKFPQVSYDDKSVHSS
jgi:NCAIR mutase (PurE)-related protein